MCANSSEDAKKEKQIRIRRKGQRGGGRRSRKERRWARRTRKNWSLGVVRKKKWWWGTTTILRPGSFKKCKGGKTPVGHCNL